MTEALIKFIKKVIDWFYIPLFRGIFSISTFRYGFCGGTNLVFDYILYYIFYNFVFYEQILHLGFVAISPHIAAFLLEFPITFFTGFWLNKNIVFPSSTKKTSVQILRYFVVVLGSIAINYLCLKLFVEHLGVIAELAKLITMIISVVYSYLMQRHFTFSVDNTKDEI